MADVTVSLQVPTLRKGRNSDARAAVLRLQQILNALGAGSLDEDGEFGADTERAVKAAQRSLNLDADGIVGKRSWTEFLKLYFRGSSLPG